MLRGAIRRAVSVLTTVAAVSIVATVAQAASIHTTVSSLGGSVWRYEFTLSSFAAGSGAGFTIYFPLSSVTALANPVSSADWDPLIFDPDSPPGADGAFDALALTAAPSLSPFSVDATIAGNTASTVLRFEIYRSSPFSIIETGFTSPPGQTAIPEPASAFLLILGLLAALIAAPGTPFRVSRLRRR